MSYKDHLNGLDIENWYRYYFIIKEVIGLKPKNVLEIGVGNEVVKNCLIKSVEDYRVMDINPKLKPDILSDLREYQPELREKFDCVICADVLEHMPFEDLKWNLHNVFSDLNKNGKALITIPHQERRVAILNLFSHIKPLIFTIPCWLHTPMTKDPNHCWEIGDGEIKKKDVEEVIKKVGFNIEKSLKLLYVDFYKISKE